MTRRHKSGLVALVALATCLIAATAAWATAFKVQAEVQKPLLTGKNEDKMKIGFNFGELSCSLDTETDSSAAEGEEGVDLELEPNLEECTVAGIAVVVDENGCAFDYDPDTIVNGKYEGTIELICPGTKTFDITAKGCTISFPPSAGFSGITFTNIGKDANREITVDRNVTGLPYFETPVGLVPTCTKASRSDGTLSGPLLVTADDPTTKKMVGLWVQ